MDLTDEFVIEAAGYRAVVVAAGGGLRELSCDGTSLVLGDEPGAVVSSGRGQVLVPWPNRIRDGAYSFAGRDYQLGLSEPATHNASHGLVRWCTWLPIAVADDAVTLGYRLAAQSGYPWTLDVTAAYAVTAGGLTVTLGATNLADTPAPFAAGMHPYLDAGCTLDETRLTLPAATHIDIDERLLPVGTSPVAGDRDFRAGRSLAGTTLDDAFLDLARDGDGRAVVRLEGRHVVELWLDAGWHCVQAFTGDALPRHARAALAVEPMTAPANAFNSGSHLITLAPGESWRASYGIRRG